MFLRNWCLENRKPSSGMPVFCLDCPVSTGKFSKLASKNILSKDFLKLESFFQQIFSSINTKKHDLTVSHLTVNLQMMSDSRRSSLVISTHLPIDQAGGR
jgi:hypothetical protein